MVLRHGRSSSPSDGCTEGPRGRRRFKSPKKLGALDEHEPQSWGERSCDSSAVVIKRGEETSPPQPCCAFLLASPGGRAPALVGCAFSAFLSSSPVTFNSTLPSPTVCPGPDCDLEGPPPTTCGGGGRAPAPAPPARYQPFYSVCLS